MRNTAEATERIFLNSFPLIILILNIYTFNIPISLRFPFNFGLFIDISAAQSRSEHSP